MNHMRSLIPMMEHAIETSFHKYGNARKTYPELAQAHRCVEERLDYYVNGRLKKDVQAHNKDYLVDIANFAMLEAMFPACHMAPVRADAQNGWRADFSTRFIDLVDEEAFAKRYKETGSTKIDEIASALAQYRKEANISSLAYIAWLAAEEFAAPTFEDAFYDKNVAGTNLSPGLAGGISYKQLMEGEW